MEFNEIKSITQNIDLASKSLSYYLCREVLEDFHSKYNISNEDMEAINKKSVNRASEFLRLLDDEDKVVAFLVLQLGYITDWDNPEISDDVLGIRKEIENYISVMKKKDVNDISYAFYKGLSEQIKRIKE